MPLHSDRRGTQQWAKKGPLQRGCLGKPAGQRRTACTGHQPGPRAAPSRRTSQDNHDASTYPHQALSQTGP